MGAALLMKTTGMRLSHASAAEKGDTVIPPAPSCRGAYRMEARLCLLSSADEVGASVAMCE